MRSERRLAPLVPGLLALLLSACGGRAAAPNGAIGDEGGTGTPSDAAPSDANVVKGPDGAAGDAGQATSWVQVTGAVQTSATCTASAFPYSDPTTLYIDLECADAATGGLTVRFMTSIGATTGPGDVLSPQGVIVNAGVSNGYQTYYAEGSYNDGPADGGTCSIVVDSYDPRHRDGLSAHFACNGLVSDLTTPATNVDIVGAIVLAPASADPPMYDGGAGAADPGDGGPPSTCALTVTGAYPLAATVGEGSVREFLEPGSPATLAAVDCTVSAGGIGYAVAMAAQSSPVGSSTLLGNTWCSPNCGIVYSSANSTCTLTTTRDDGVQGGRFVGSFTCSGLTAFDGSESAFSATIDAIIEPQPIGG